MRKGFGAVDRRIKANDSLLSGILNMGKLEHIIIACTVHIIVEASKALIIMIVGFLG